MQLDFIPDYATWDEYNSNFIHYFGEQQLPLVVEDDWMQFAYALVRTTAFDKFNTPLPDNYEEWQDWARALTMSVNGA
jgi:hypothetical protein